MQQRPSYFTLNGSAPLANGLVFAGLAPGGLVGSTLYPDSSLYNNNGTLVNFVPATDWIFNSYLGRWGLSGYSTDNVVITDGGKIIPDQTLRMTLSTWIKDAGQYCYYVTNTGTFGSTTGKYLLATDGSTKLKAFFFGAGHEYTILGGSAISSGYHHIAVTLDISRSPKAILYLDGVDISGTVTESVNLPYISVGATTYIAAYVGGAQDVTRQQWDTLIHRRCLSQSEISQLADPSNVFLSGLILPPRRKWWPVVSGAPTNYYIPNKMRYYRNRRIA